MARSFTNASEQRILISQYTFWNPHDNAGLPGSADGTLSVSFWIKADEHSSYLYVYDCRSVHRCSTQCPGDGGSLYFYIRAPDEYLFWSFPSPYDQLTDGDWHHLAYVNTATFSASGNHYIYYDGTQVSTDTAAQRESISTPDGNCNIAAQYYEDTSRFYSGDLAEFAIWKRPLSAAEVAALAKGFSPKLFPRYLTAYTPIIGQASPEPDVVNSSTGTLYNSPPTVDHEIPIKHFVLPLIGYGSLAADILGAGTIAGTGTLTGSGAVVRESEGSVSGTSALTGVAGLDKLGEGAVAGTSTLTGVAGLDKLGEGSIAGTSTLTGVAGLDKLGEGSIAGTSTLTGVAGLDKLGEGSIAGSSTLVGTSAVDLGGVGTVTGVSTVTGAATIEGGVEGAGEIAATSTVAGAAALELEVSGSVDAESELLGAATVEGGVNGQGTVAAVGTLLGTAAVEQEGTGTIAGQSTLVAESALDLEGTGTVVAQATLVGTGAFEGADVLGAGTISASALLSAAPAIDRGGVGEIAAAGTVSGIQAVAAFDGSAAVDYLALGVLTAVSDLHATGWIPSLYPYPQYRGRLSVDKFGGHIKADSFKATIKLVKP
jgi:hypothetical protein